jgi:diacylglycerol kinase (ATP)
MRRIAAAFQNSKSALRRAFREEPALRQEMLLIAIAIPLAFLITDDAFQRAELIGAILLVLAVELLNTAIEKLCDKLHPKHDPQIGYVKDLGSAAVLAAILMASALWLAAFWRLADRYI